MSDAPSYPVLPARYTVLFPGITITLTVKRAAIIAAVNGAAEKVDHEMVVVTQRRDKKATPADLYRMGCLAQVEVVSSRKKAYLLKVTGISRFKISAFVKEKDYLLARGETIPDRRNGSEPDILALVNTLRTLASEVIKLLPRGIEGAVNLLQRLEDPGLLTHFCSTILDAPVERKQEFLETVSLRKRLEMLIENYKIHRDTLSIQKEIGNRLARKLVKEEREVILREQLKEIQEQLGEGAGALMESLAKRIDSARLPDEVIKVARYELERLRHMEPDFPEVPFIRSYLEWLTSLSWRRNELAPIDIEKAKYILDEDHFGLEKVKRRIIEHLAVIQLKKDFRGGVLCFVGPPGVGKTSLGQSIARALGRPFVKTGLGGLRDEGEIRGHRRTYVGAMPGRIIQGIKRAGNNNPLFMLDEIDKLSVGFQGDPASALLEVLDPEQNWGFVDNYMDVPYDLSNVFFVTTANTLEEIPPALLDRMEVVELHAYTIQEKLQIAKRYLFPRLLLEHGLTPAEVNLQVNINDEMITRLIISYTHEAGIRELKRVIAALLRSAAAKIVRGLKAPIEIDLSYLDEALGPERFIPEARARTPLPGVVTALAWTPMGGEILFIETRIMPGKGLLLLTGQLGEVMKESAQIALSIVRSDLAMFGVAPDFEKRDLHVHVPSGAIQKDGPSAGAAILSAIASLITGKRIDPKLAMTGEITLRGAVLPVGGIKEKVLAAHRAGFEQVILPKQNEKDLREIPEEVRMGLHFDFVETTLELLERVLGLKRGAPLIEFPPKEEAISNAKAA